jgi:amino acid permease
VILTFAGDLMVEEDMVTHPSYRSIDIEPNNDSLHDDSSLLVDDDDDDHLRYLRVSNDENDPACTIQNRIPMNNNHNNNPDSADIASEIPTSFPATSTTIPRHKRMSGIAASFALMKGNLGPGILNLPHAFAKAGPMLGATLFIIVSIQGLYSMTLLVSCKNWIVQQQHQHQQSYRTTTTDHPSSPDPLHNTVRTFMDVTKFALGNIGGRITEIFVFVLQLGVCCVFISLIATNLQAAFHWLSSGLTIALIAIFMMLAVLIRFLKDLFWLNAIANTFMFIAILTATIASIINIHHNTNQPASNTATHGTISTAITFTADMFFAFEGIGLVLPVENNYDHHHSTTTSASTSSCKHRRWNFSRVLLSSMGCVAILFGMTGLTASIGFPNIESASITAYLKQTYPDIMWFSIVNFLVLAAVAFTFPLQLTPAMEVLEKWLSECPPYRRSSVNNVNNESNSVHQNTVIARSTEEVYTTVVHNTISTPTTLSASLWNQYGWIARRWMVVITCATFVLIVDDLGILVSLFGAIGQTGLAGMPCAVHLVLQRHNMAPKNVFLSLADILILIFCAFVMVSGCYLSIRDIINKSR